MSDKYKDQTTEALIQERLSLTIRLNEIDREIFRRNFNEYRKTRRKPSIKIEDLAEEGRSPKGRRKTFTSRTGGKATRLDDLLKKMPKEQLLGLQALLSKKKDT